VRHANGVRVGQGLIVLEMQIAQLLFVASVDESRKLVCQAPGCGRAIAKAVHVIRDLTGAIWVVGSGCYATLSGHEQATRQGAVIEGFDGRRLTTEERALMVADTAAFVAGVVARLAADMEAARQAREEMEAEAQRSRGHRIGAATPAPYEWEYRIGGSSKGMRTSEPASARDKLAQFRAQQALQAARVAIQRWPELSRHSLDVVADAMSRAKAEYLGRGLRMDAPDARSVIESLAIAALADRDRGAPS
jgi:hypothetical protein